MDDAHETSKAGSKKGSDTSNFIRNMGKLQSDQKIILYMPSDLQTLYEESLAGRLKNSGIKLKLAGPDELLDELGAYDRIMAFQCPLPAFVTEEEKEGKDETPKTRDLFEVKGAPAAHLMTPFPRKAGLFTDLENRHQQLKAAIAEQEQNKYFRNLAMIQQNIRSKLLAVTRKQKEADLLLNRIEDVDTGYFMVLAYYLQKAIDNALQLVTLGDVMKKYIKILIIDDLGERTLERLEEQGFRRRFISTMSQQSFDQTFAEFRELYLEQFPGEEVTIQDFFSKCTVFDDYEIVAYNQWASDKDSMPVLFRLKKNAELSQKDIRKLKQNPAKLESSKNKLELELQKLTDLLAEVDLELRSSEAKGGVSESAYVGLNKKRKRLVRNIKNTEVELTDIQNEVDVSPELTIRSRDFLETLKDRKTVKLILAQKGAEGVDPDLLSSSGLNTLAGLSRQKQKMQQQIGEMNQQVKLMNQKMNEYAALHPLDPEKPFQQILGIHALNKLEMAILGCGISRVNGLLNSYQGPFFGSQDGQSLIGWEDKKLKQISIHVASKHIKINTTLLSRFFQVTTRDMSGRIENSPALPRAGDFNNKKYGLFVINFNSYPISDIINCLKLRNKSSNSAVPLLLIDPMQKVDISNEKTMLELLVGLKKEGDGKFNFMTPTYRIDSLENSETLNFVLCEIMGIDIATLPSSATDVDSDADLEDDSFMTSSLMETQEESVAFEDSSPEVPESAELELPTGAATPNLSIPKVAPPTSSPRKDNRIKLYSRSEKKEEIYTLGALFSFDDDTAAPPPRKATHLDAAMEGDPVGAASKPALPETVEMPADDPPDAASEPVVRTLPPVKQKMNPKTPFQF